MTKSTTIIITGASSGLGAGMAREFAARGYHLGLCARRTDRLEALRDELVKAHGIRVELIALDVNDHPQVFAVFDEFKKRFGHLDRVIVNAGVGEGRRIGTGHFETNKRTAETNFIAALAQCEAAVAIFREQKAGHLVLMSSMSAMRGLPRHLTTYAASKAAVAHLGEGLRAELLGTPIKVSTIYPGYIRTEMNAGAKKLTFEVSEEVGSRALAKAIEKAPAEACVPAWPWTVVGFFMRVLPLRWVIKMS
jgi:short-subunit dehydrogenase